MLEAAELLVEQKEINAAEKSSGISLSAQGCETKAIEVSADV